MFFLLNEFLGKQFNFEIKIALLCYDDIKFILNLKVIVSS